jgi:hypothetical protein
METMNAPKIWKLVPAVMVCCVVGLASAKLPAPPPVDPAKAEEAKQKAADAAKKEAESMAKAQDRVADRYKKQQKVAAAPATTAAKKK